MGNRATALVCFLMLELVCGRTVSANETTVTLRLGEVTVTDQVDLSSPRATVSLWRLADELLEEVRSREATTHFCTDLVTLQEFEVDFWPLYETAARGTAQSVAIPALLELLQSPSLLSKEAAHSALATRLHQSKYPSDAGAADWLVDVYERWCVLPPADRTRFADHIRKQTSPTLVEAYETVDSTEPSQLAAYVRTVCEADTICRMFLSEPMPHLATIDQTLSYLQSQGDVSHTRVVIGDDSLDCRFTCKIGIADRLVDVFRGASAIGSITAVPPAARDALIVSFAQRSYRGATAFPRRDIDQVISVGLSTPYESLPRFVEAGRFFDGAPDLAPVWHGAPDGGPR